MCLLYLAIVEIAVKWYMRRGEAPTPRQGPIIPLRVEPSDRNGSVMMCDWRVGEGDYLPLMFA
jgi:hypothetical protein